jgi:hypothetical protein
MPLPQLLPEAASAWEMAVAVEVAVAGLVSWLRSWVGSVGTVAGGVGVLAVWTGGAGLQPGNRRHQKAQQTRHYFCNTATCSCTKNCRAVT